MSDTICSSSHKIASDFLVAAGAALFPVHSHNRKPASKWRSETSTDPKQWAEWRASGFELAISACASKLILIDVDVKGDADRDDSWALFATWCSSLGIEVPRPYCQSRNGGWHFAYRAPEGFDPETHRGLISIPVSKLRPLKEGERDRELISIRNRGYCIAPGSTFDGKEYRLFPNAPAPLEFPPSLIELLVLPIVEASIQTGDAGTSDVTDVAKLVAFLDNHGEFDTEPEWFASLGAVKLALGDTEDALTVARQMTNDDATEDALMSRWTRLATVDPGGPRVRRIGTLITRYKDITGRPFVVGKSVQAIFAGAIPTVQSPSLAPAVPLPDLIQTSAQFVQGFVPPDYLVDGILQRRFCYSMTARTGVGKTAVAMLVSAHVAAGRSLGAHDVAKGSVLYFAGENPTDIQMRWLGLTRDIGIDPAAMDVHFIAGAMPLSQIAARVTDEVARKGLTLALVVVDTAAAYFEGDDENSNTQAVDHAKRMRSLTTLPGGPCVVILCHPTKRAADDDLIPRGGGAFLAEVDGNVALRKAENVIAATSQGKFRGSDSWALTFELKPVQHPELKDSKGRDIWTVVAQPLSEAGKKVAEAANRRQEDLLLKAIEAHPGASLRELATYLGWLDGRGQPAAMKVSRAADVLEKEKLIRKHRGAWELTTAGERELNRLDVAQVRKYPLTAGDVTARVTAPPPFPPTNG